MSLTDLIAAAQAELEQLLTCEREIVERRRRVAAALLALHGHTTSDVPVVDVPGSVVLSPLWRDEAAASVRLDGDTIAVGPPAPASPPDLAGEAPTSGPVPSTQPTARRDGGAPGPGRTRNYDYAEVAAVARQAFEAGQMIAPTVAARFGITVTAAKQLVTRAERAGHPVPRPGKSYAALRRNPAALAPAKPVADPTPAPKPEPRTADELPAPADRPANTWTPKPGELVLACTDCTTVVPLRPALIESHCRLHHQRRASGIERTPTPYEPEDGAA